MSLVVKKLMRLCLRKLPILFAACHLSTLSLAGKRWNFGFKGAVIDAGLTIFHTYKAYIYIKHSSSKRLEGIWSYLEELSWPRMAPSGFGTNKCDSESTITSLRYSRFSEPQFPWIIGHHIGHHRTLGTKERTALGKSWILGPWGTGPQIARSSHFFGTRTFWSPLQKLPLLTSSKIICSKEIKSWLKMGMSQN